MRPIKHIFATAAVTLATTIMLTPAAQARPISVASGASSAIVHDTPLANPVATPNAYEARYLRLLHPATQPTQPAVTPTIEASNESFDWTTTAIGTGAGCVLMAVLAGSITI